MGYFVVMEDVCLLFLSVSYENQSAHDGEENALLG